LKILVISGAHRSAGKTTLARRFKALFPDRALILKIGHGPEKNKEEILFHDLADAQGFIRKCRLEAKTDLLILESNQIQHVLKPDLSIFIEALNQPEKQSSEGARTAADIVIGEGMNLSRIREILSGRGIFSAAVLPRVDRILEKFCLEYTARKEKMKTENQVNPQLEVTVNGKRVSTNPFVKDIISYAILGMIRPLKGIDEPKEVVIKIITG